MAASTSLFLGVSMARAETGRPASVLVVFLALFITIGLVGPESLSNILTLNNVMAEMQFDMSTISILYLSTSVFYVVGVLSDVYHVFGDIVC